MPEPDRPSPQFMKEIEGLELTSRPLIICDADEVLLHFIRHMHALGQEQGIALREPIYRLHNNLVETKTGRLLSKTECDRFISQFFETVVHRQDAVDHAALQLAALREHVDIIILTNLPGTANRAARIKLLAELGMDYPLITNSGPKGGAVAELGKGRGSNPVVFIDDSPQNLISARTTAPHVQLVHFVADPVFFVGAPQIDGVAFRSCCWIETGAYLKEVFGLA
ncbi:hypothetical protein PUV47_12240 [Pseudovibrio exalbescens]|uniref:hypothetical protein n=1 Tax=Pseudovibrio exalbescens TaxID=197461 RepID=UPI0023650435|nr:hypothetical protein [Pseudovibrio exalbescens]MDD7910688.1 hypothetical protein [Pseudovibrio exalbescens]